MLSWSAETTGREVNIEAVADASVDSGIEGGPALRDIALAAAGNETDSSSVEDAAAALGPEAAVDAAAVAAGFEVLNRIVDAVGLPVGKGEQKRMAQVIDLLGLDDMPHATHT